MNRFLNKPDFQRGENQAHGTNFFLNDRSSLKECATIVYLMDESSPVNEGY